MDKRAITKIMQENSSAKEMPFLRVNAGSVKTEGYAVELDPVAGVLRLVADTKSGRVPIDVDMASITVITSKRVPRPHWLRKPFED